MRQDWVGTGSGSGLSQLIDRNTYSCAVIYNMYIVVSFGLFYLFTGCIRSKLNWSTIFQTILGRKLRILFSTNSYCLLQM